MLPELGERLGVLLRSERFTVAVISSRSVADLRSKVKLDAICAGNHGLEIEGRGVSFIHPEAELLRDAIDHASWDLEAAFYDVRGAFVERKGLGATVHYRQANPALSEWIELTCVMVTQPYQRWVKVVASRMALDIRPRVAWDKGSAVRYLLGRCSGESLLVCAGDDATDEDMFSVSAEAISIQVGGSQATRARYSVEGPGELSGCLDVLCEGCGQ